MGRDQAVDPLACTVAIVSYKTPELAKRCLASMRPPQPWMRDVTIVENAQDNIGYAAALARVFANADTPLLLALNADVQFPEQDITPLLELFNAKPRLGLLGVRQRDSRGFLTHCGICDPGSPDGGQCYGEADTGQYTEPAAVIAQVSGSVMFIRRSAYEQVGGFANMPRLYYEDAILCLRLRRRGWSVGYSGLLTFQHDVASSPSDERAVLAAEGRKAWEAEVARGIGT